MRYEFCSIAQRSFLNVNHGKCPRGFLERGRSYRFTHHQCLSSDNERPLLLPRHEYEMHSSNSIFQLFYEPFRKYYHNSADLNR